MIESILCYSVKHHRLDGIEVVLEGDSLKQLFDLNDKVEDLVLVECERLKFSMEQIINLGKSIHFLALNDDEMSKLSQLHSYLDTTNGACDNLRDKLSQFVDDRYDQYLAAIPFSLSSSQIQRLGDPTRLGFANAIAQSNLGEIQSFFLSNEIKTAMELAEIKKLKISSEIIKLSTATKEIQLGLESSLAITKIKNDFLTIVEKSADDLMNHIEHELKFDDLLKKINKCIESIINAQKGIPKELALSFLI